MATRFIAPLAFAAMFAAAIPCSAFDPWDHASENDDGPDTDNALAHGAEQVHDLAAKGGLPDEDWYLLVTEGRSSYEVAIDNTTGDLDLAGPDVSRIGPDGGTVVQDGTLVSGGSVVLRWQNTTPDPQTNYVRVRGAQCGTACSAQDQYRIRMYETTSVFPIWARYFTIASDSPSFQTVFRLANGGGSACSARAHFYFDSGAYVGSLPCSFAPYGACIFDTGSASIFTQPTYANLQGSVRVAHTCGHGQLAGMAHISRQIPGKYDPPRDYVPLVPRLP